MSNTTTMQTLEEKFIKFLDEELTPIGMSDKKTIERVKWYYNTYFRAKQQLPEIAKKEPVNFLLANALKLCTPDQLIALRDLLIERTPKQQVVIEDEYIYTLSPYQIGYLESLFKCCDAPEPHNISVQFIGMQPTGNLHIGYIKYGIAQRDFITREPQTHGYSFDSEKDVAERLARLTETEKDTIRGEH